MWVRDKAPRVENIFGFVEPYRDPHGIRSEFEGLVAIANDGETKLLARLVENSAKFIRQLPWVARENTGNGPFEKNLFEPPDFSSIHSTQRRSTVLEDVLTVQQLLHTAQALYFLASICLTWVKLPR
jgi:dipeptidyl-peptidase-3